MTMFIFGLIILIVGIAGLIITLIFSLLALIKRKSGNWKRTGVALGISIGIVIGLILIQNLILYPLNQKLDKLVLSASREAPLGGIWLGIYEDHSWQLGYSSREITSEGIYEIAGDTLTLIAQEGKYVIGEVSSTSFLIDDKYLKEINNSGIRSLQIHKNIQE